MLNDTPCQPKQSLAFDERGTASLEYLILMVSFTIAVSLSIAELGPGIIAVFDAQILWLSLPVP